MTTNQTGLPPINRRRKRLGDTFDADSKAREAQANPGTAVLALSDVKIGIASTIRKYRNAPFVTDSGNIEVNVRNSRVDLDGVRRGDIYFTWKNN